jgi:hypothetical protein
MFVDGPKNLEIIPTHSEIVRYDVRGQDGIPPDVGSCLSRPREAAAIAQSPGQPRSGGQGDLGGDDPHVPLAVVCETEMPAGSAGDLGQSWGTSWDATNRSTASTNRSSKQENRQGVPWSFGQPKTLSMSWAIRSRPRPAKATSSRSSRSRRSADLPEGGERACRPAIPISRVFRVISSSRLFR